MVAPTYFKTVVTNRGKLLFGEQLPPAQPSETNPPSSMGAAPLLSSEAAEPPQAAAPQSQTDAPTAPLSRLEL